jgi:hypothetical protein
MSSPPRVSRRSPLFATANLLLTFCPKEKHWCEYMDQMWDATEKAERTNLSVLPALMFHAHKDSLGQSKYYRQVFIDIAHPYD